MNKYITAYYTDENDLIKGVKQIREKGHNILDVFTPFPVHGLDVALGMRRSRLTRVAFGGGAVGAIVGFGFQAWVFTKAYPLNFGGKPYLSVPSFIPVTFELAVLLAAFSMVIAFFIHFKLGPGAKTVVYDERCTDDRFLVLIDAENAEADEVKKIEKALSDAGAEGITYKE